MIKKILLSLSLGFFIQLNIACAGDSTAIRLIDIKPEPQHQLAFQTSIQLVSSYHYAKPRIDDVFSSKALDNYLKHIDPSHAYFLKSDIELFEKNRYTIDDAVLNGNADFAFEIFNVYRQRLQDRIDFALTLLRDSFAFAETDSFEIDREKSNWCKDYKELDALWNQKVRFECLALAVSGKAYANYSETVKKRYENLLKFSSKTKSEDVFQMFMNAILELADPHTNYFSPRTAEDFKQSMSLSLEGIGAQLRTENEYTKVNEIIKGGPADKSKKIHAGDKIIGVSQSKDSEIVNVVDWRIDDVVALIRGKKGTLVRLEIIPASEPNKTRIIELIRDKIVLEDQSAKSSVKEITRKGKKYKVGVISIPTFYIDFAAAQKGDPNFKSTTRDVKKLITELKKEKITGLILDLRNNGGGSLKEAVDLTGLFVATGPVVQVKDQTENIREESDQDPEIFYDGPLTVLVNRFSASASEILSAAIQDYHRGIVIGEKTYGKGTVQDIIDLNQYVRPVNNKPVGQVKLTIAKFYRINGSSTQHKGVTPDIIVPGIYDHPKFGEDASEFALQWDQIQSTSFTALNTLYDTATLNRLATERLISNKEFTYLKEDIKYLNDLDARTYHTLNKTQWKQELDEQENRKKVREEERKLVKEKTDSKSDLILWIGEETILDLLGK